MILNVSGRTDIVAFYSEWFMNRYREGFVDVRNPVYPKMVSRIYFEDVDAILFCTKNPLPMLKYIEMIKEPFLFHVTLTPYKKEIEPHVPAKGNVIEAIKQLSQKIGKERVVVRYDPIFVSEKYSIDYHKKAFHHLCSLLDGYVSKIIVSFLDDYKNVRKNMIVIGAREMTEADYREIGLSFSESAKEHGMTVQTCFEEKNLVEYGFVKDDCFSHSLAFQMTGKIFPKWKARKGNLCQCVEMVDIGAYNTCSHFCKYCYANYDERQVEKNRKQHHPTSSLLIGTLKDDDEIKVRKDK